MKLCFRELLSALSYVLDCVEHELVGVTGDHAKRVAYLCVRMGKRMGLTERELSDLAACALLHDNALTEYIQTEWNYILPEGVKVEGKKTGIHCSMGERNCRSFPFHGDVTGAILYHHENADGSGPFERKAENTPVFARLIHLADQVDSRFHLDRMPEGGGEAVFAFVGRLEGKWFDKETAELFRHSIGPEVFADFAAGQADRLTMEMLPYEQEEFTPEQMKAVASVFARMIDYKSGFTSRHSMGIAEKAYAMGRFYGWEEEKCARFYLAGGLHDIGKAAVDNSILEKPGKLTPEEFGEIKKHASVTYEILSKVRGMEELACWAAFHHERLNGKGYPFGYGGDRLGFEERLMACLDVYQALEEPRPYKDGMSHEKIIGMMRQMADDNWLDRERVEDVNTVFERESRPAAAVAPGGMQRIVGAGKTGSDDTNEKYESDI